MQEQRTSEEWWSVTKRNEAALHAWLYDQYRGEVTAAGRIEALRDAFTTPASRPHRVLTAVAGQERKHAEWVAELLRARGLDVHVEPVEERYWKRTVPEVVDLATGAAIGAHAERMRLERIVVIASDPDVDDDIRSAFRRILPEERFHERAFRGLASAAALESTAGAHELARRALGLTP